MALWPACLSCVTGICYFAGWGERGGGGGECSTVIWSLNPMCHALNSTGWAAKNGMLQFLWMNQLALPDVLHELVSCKCQLNGLFVPMMFVHRKKWAVM